MRLYAFHAGGERFPMGVFDAFDPKASDIVEAPYFFYLIQHPQGNVLFDTGAHPDLIDNPRKRLGGAADDWDITMTAGDDVVSKLEKFGLPLSKVERVALSHLHYDHCGGIEFFPAATFYAQRDELRYAHWPAVFQKSLYVRADFDHPVRWKELQADHDMFGDGRVVLFRTPGHSPGHQSMLVRLDGGNIILTADAAYTPEKLAARATPAGVLTWSGEAMCDSWERLEEWQQRYDAQLIFTHDLAFKTRTRLAPEAWYE